MKRTSTSNPSRVRTAWTSTSKDWNLFFQSTQHRIQKERQCLENWKQWRQETSLEAQIQQSQTHQWEGLDPTLWGPPEAREGWVWQSIVEWEARQWIDQLAPTSPSIEGPPRSWSRIDHWGPIALEWRSYRRSPCASRIERLSEFKSFLKPYHQLWRFNDPSLFILGPQWHWVTWNEGLQSTPPEDHANYCRKTQTVRFSLFCADVQTSLKGTSPHHRSPHTQALQQDWNRSFQTQLQIGHNLLGDWEWKHWPDSRIQYWIGHWFQNHLWMDPQWDHPQWDSLWTDPLFQHHLHRFIEHSIDSLKSRRWNHPEETRETFDQLNAVFQTRFLSASLRIASPTEAFSLPQKRL